MRKRIFRSVLIIMASWLLGIDFIVFGLSEANVEVFIVGLLIMFVGLLIMFVGSATAYLHLTYRDDDNKYW